MSERVWIAFDVTTIFEHNVTHFKHQSIYT